MTIEQEWLVAPTTYTFEQCMEICVAEGCVGFFTGIPPFLQQQAADEGWTLPHFWIETVVIPEDPPQGG